MEDEIIKDENEDSNFKDLLAQLEELKSSSISKEEYNKAVEKLKSENKQLIASLTKAPVETAPTLSKEESFKKAKELSDKIAKWDHNSKNDIELIETIREFRKHSIEVGIDPFAGVKISQYGKLSSKKSADDLDTYLGELVKEAKTRRVSVGMVHSETMD